MIRSEKEKMLAGEPYDCTDPGLLARWHEAKRLQSLYNAAPTTDLPRLSALLDLLLGSRGENVWIAAPFFVDYGENIHLGRNVEINMNCVFLDCNRITIGDYSGIGPGVHIYTVFHPTEPAERLSETARCGVADGSGRDRPQCLDRSRSVILPGVTIGDGTTVGAGSVVTRSLPEGVVAAGNPCRILRKL